MNSRRAQMTLFISCLGIAVMAGCGGSSASTNGGASLGGEATTFLGLNAIEKQGDDAWVLSWNPIDFNGAIYTIFKAKEGDSFNYAEPFTTTQGSSFRYKSENVLSEPSQCFVVRIQSTGNVNTKSLCTGNQPTIFAGIGSLERQGDGTYVLHWIKLPVDDATYNVFERVDDEQYDETRPSYSVSTEFLQTALFKRGEKHCFMVRVSHRDYGADSNLVELCTNAEELIDFSEVGNAIAVASPERAAGQELGSVVVDWLPSATTGVVGYRVLHDFAEPMRCSEANAKGLVEGNRCTVANLTPGIQRSVVVKAVDAFDRESENYVSFPVVVK